MYYLAGGVQQQGDAEYRGELKNSKKIASKKITH
jgi:hypothetical protein